MAEEKKTETAEPCCTVKVVMGKAGTDCCSEVKGERVIKVVCDPETMKSGRTIKVVCCPDDAEAKQD